MNNNVLQSYTIRRSSDRPDAISVDLQGHRSVVKSVTLSPDNTLLMSTSHTKVKIWDLTTHSCIRTIDSGRGLCGLILPQNNFAIVGTEEGTIEIIGIYNGMCLEAVNAHGGFVRSIAAIPDQTSFLTGGADHVIKFWEYRIIPKPGQVCSSYILLLTFLIFVLYLIIYYLGYLSQVENLFYEQCCTHTEGPIISSIILLNDNDEGPSAFY